MSAATATIDGEDIVIRITMPRTVAASHAVADHLIRLDREACDAAGFELGGLRAKVRSGDLPTVKIGRSYYVRSSDLCALAKPAPAGVDADVEASFAMALAREPRRRKAKP